MLKPDMIDLCIFLQLKRLVIITVSSFYISVSVQKAKIQNPLNTS